MIDARQLFARAYQIELERWQRLAEHPSERLRNLAAQGMKILERVAV
jgi:hypothetical protein